MRWHFRLNVCPMLIGRQFSLAGRRVPNRTQSDATASMRDDAAAGWMALEQKRNWSLWKFRTRKRSRVRSARRISVASTRLTARFQWVTDRR